MRACSSLIARSAACERSAALLYEYIYIDFTVLFVIRNYSFIETTRRDKKTKRTRFIEKNDKEMTIYEPSVIDIAKKTLITQGLVHASMFKSCEISRSNSSHIVLFITFSYFLITNPNLIYSITQKNRYFT